MRVGRGRGPLNMSRTIARLIGISSRAILAFPPTLKMATPMYAELEQLDTTLLNAEIRKYALFNIRHRMKFCFKRLIFRLYFYEFDMIIIPLEGIRSW